MSKKVKTFLPGEEVAIALEFEYEGDREIESVEAVFVQEASHEEISFLGDARKEGSNGGQTKRYTTRLGARIAPGASPGEYRCARLCARDRLDDDWDFADATKLDLVIHVERTPLQLKVTASEFL